MVLPESAMRLLPSVRRERIVRFRVILLQFVSVCTWKLQSQYQRILFLEVVARTRVRYGPSGITRSIGKKCVTTWNF